MADAELIYRIHDARESDPISVPLNTYPDTMPLVAFTGVAGLPKDVLLRPRSLASFVAAMFWVDALTERYDHVPHLILPCVPGARQDRLNDSGDFLFTIKSVAKMLNARHFPSVTVIDPHSDVTPALIDHCEVIHAADCVDAPAGKYAAVISPDAGAEKRAGGVARKLGVPLIHAWKTRDVKSGAISGFGIEQEALERLPGGSKVLVVDDICDGGGTFIGLAKACHAITAGSLDLQLFVTHGIFSKGVAPLKEHYSHIYCTDSILGAREGVIEIPVSQRFFEGSL